MKHLVATLSLLAAFLLTGCSNLPNSNSNNSNNSSNPSSPDSPTPETLSVSNFIYTIDDFPNNPLFEGTFQAGINPPLTAGTPVNFSVNGSGLGLGVTFPSEATGDSILEVDMGATSLTGYDLTSYGCLDATTVTVAAYANGSELASTSVAVDCTNAPPSTNNERRAIGRQIRPSRPIIKDSFGIPIER